MRLAFRWWLNPSFALSHFHSAHGISCSLLVTSAQPLYDTICRFQARISHSKQCGRICVFGFGSIWSKYFSINTFIIHSTQVGCIFFSCLVVVCVYYCIYFFISFLLFVSIQFMYNTAVNIIFRLFFCSSFSSSRTVDWIIHHSYGRVLCIRILFFSKLSVANSHICSLHIVLINSVSFLFWTWTVYCTLYSVYCVFVCALNSQIVQTVANNFCKTYPSAYKYKIHRIQLPYIVCMCVCPCVCGCDQDGICHHDHGKYNWIP